MLRKGLSYKKLDVRLDKVKNIVSGAKLDLMGLSRSVRLSDLRNEAEIKPFKIRRRKKKRDKRGRNEKRMREEGEEKDLVWRWDKTNWGWGKK